jgi:hypothetical protein
LLFALLVESRATESANGGSAEFIQDRRVQAAAFHRLSML